VAVTDIQIINNALHALGRNRITALADNTVEAETANDTYEFLKEQFMSMHPWTWTFTEFGPLSKDVATPPSEFTVQYSLPANFWSLRKIVDFTFDYEITQDKKLWTDFDGDIYIQYSIEVSEDDIPPYVRRSFILFLALEWAAELTLDDKLEDRIEKRFERAYRIAKTVDSQQRKKTGMTNFPLITARG